ncbi:MAG TPA: carbohydrate kinase [Streptosporangiaceae bacterium]|nr:carbohydrate kinase [Streptosporangiaceae bacterium]
MPAASAPGHSEEGSPGAGVTVIGEAIVDLIPAGQPRTFQAVPGGSPYNVAVGLARLGHDAMLMARLADTAFGRILRDHAQAEGIDLGAAPAAPEPATLAVVSLDASAAASYDFYLTGTADWQWTAEETGRVPERTAVFHFGSIASWTPPGDERILILARRLRRRGDVLITYDPNVRPGLLRDYRHGQRVVERAVELAHLTKASTDDVAWLYPDRAPAEVARGWLALGATVVVITSSADGAFVYTAGGLRVRRPALAITVVDTVGAGDSFTAGLIGSLIGRGQHAPGDLARCSAEQLSGALDDAILVASLNCERRGNDPPTAADVAAARSRLKPI